MQRSIRVALCHGCSQRIDGWRSKARVVEGRVVSVCDACATGELPAQPAPVQRIERVIAADETSVPPRRRRPSHLIAVVACAAGVTVALVGARGNEAAMARASVPTPSATVDLPEVHHASVVLDDASWTFYADRPATRDGQWIHPVPGARELVPRSQSRVFGAERPGERPAACQLGHCGVDLTGPRGTPVVAVAAGMVARIELSPEHSGGRYVRIVHADGSQTWYMHLDRIAPGLERGMHIEAGAMLGTLGLTGIHHSRPHLHFAYQDVEDGRLRYTDPAERLGDAAVIDVLDVDLPDELEVPGLASLVDDQGDDEDLVAD